MRRLAKLWLVGWLGSSVLHPQEDKRDLAVYIQQVLDGVRQSSDVAKAARELGGLGAGAVEPIFLHLSNASGEAARRAVLLGSFAQLPRPEVLAFLERTVRQERGTQPRCAALDLLGRLGTRSELRLVLEFAAPGDSVTPIEPQLRAAVENALFGVLSREPTAARALADLYPRVEPGTQASIAAVFARLGGETAVGLLAGLLGGGTEADLVVLLELTKAARSGTLIEDLLVFERVRGALGHPDARVVSLAALLCEKLGDQGAVPELIVLLEDSRTNVRSGAHAALRRLTGLSLGVEAGPWLAWLDEGLAWWDDRGDACRVALTSGSPTAAAAALAEVARQRLYQHEVARLLFLATRREEPDLVRMACKALGALPIPVARALLQQLSSQAEAETAALASAALVSAQVLRPVGRRDRRVSLPTLKRIP